MAAWGDHDYEGPERRSGPSGRRKEDAMQNDADHLGVEAEAIRRGKQLHAFVCNDPEGEWIADQKCRFALYNDNPEEAA